jgi:hypothetical protein
MKNGWIALLILVFLGTAQAQQLWTGVLNSGRAVSWQGSAGFNGSGVLPDSGWAQCITTACNTVISAGSSATVAQINAAIASAPANTYVSLSSGTFNVTSPIIISANGSLRNNVVLRGQGANSTFLVYSGSSAGGGCYSDVVNLEGSCAGTYSNGEQNVCVFAGANTASTVTAGTYATGSTYLSITNCGSTTPALGSISNLKVGSIIMVDQLNEANDTGTIWNCDTSSTTYGEACAGNGSGGGVREDGLCNSGICDRSQVQGFVVVSINGSVVQVDQPLYLSQWRTSQQPQAWFPTTTATNIGVENLSVDTTSATGFTSTLSMTTCNACWVAGVRSVDSNRSHVRFIFSTHSVMRDSYLYKNQSGSSSSYGMEIAGGWYNLIENNITQQVTDSDPSCTAPCAGNVVDYNFDVDNLFTAGNSIIVPGFFQHASGDVFNLWEGNIGPGYSGDNIHGTHHFETVFRNTLPGWQSQCTGGACVSQTRPVDLAAGNRYFNIIGNVLGQSGYHTVYQCQATTSNTFCPQSFTQSGKDTMIFNMGYVENTYSVDYGFCNSLPAGSCTSNSTGLGSGNLSLNWDTQVVPYLMRWGNYDVITGTSRFCGNSSDTGWSTTCGSTSEVPAALSLYSNSVPTLGDTGAGQSAMPPSFFYNIAATASGGTGLPFWKNPTLGTTPNWPAAGPDVTSGNLGNCSGGTYAGMAAILLAQCGSGTLASAWAGHSNANPAMECFLGVMGGPPDGTGSVLSFNRASCYATDLAITSAPVTILFARK